MKSIAILLGAVLVVSAVLGVPFFLLLALAGFSGGLSDAGPELNNMMVIACLGIAIAMVLAPVAWIKYVINRI